MDRDLYTRITTQLGSSIGALFDGKEDDGWSDYTPPVITVQGIDGIPTVSIDGPIVLTERRIQCSIRADDLDDARAVRQSLIDAIHGWKGGAIKACALENEGPELYESDAIPRTYHLPVDFMLTY